jgi:sulfoxide reductase heme-binding subunit YedZ
VDKSLQFFFTDMPIVKKILGSRYLLWLLLYAPSVSLVAGFVNGTIYYGEILHASGEFSARLLLLTLAAAPLSMLFPRRAWTQWLVAKRRYFGVATFVYGLLHTVIYVNKQGSAAVIMGEALQFEMWTAWLAFLIFVPLALTSNDQSVRLLKSGWKKLHRWVHVAAVFLHWIFIAFDFVPGLIHLMILVAIESVRMIKLRRQPAV